MVCAQSLPIDQLYMPKKTLHILEGFQKKKILENLLERTKIEDFRELRDQTHRPIAFLASTFIFILLTKL